MLYFPHVFPSFNEQEFQQTFYSSAEKLFNIAYFSMINTLDKSFLNLKFLSEIGKQTNLFK